MILMPSNWSAGHLHYLAGKYPSLLGHLYSPAGQRGPYPWLPYALDNGAYAAWSRNRPFDMSAWLRLLDWAKQSGQAPRWVLIPDAVGDKDLTLYQWSQLADQTRRQYGWPLAFAAQDGMTPGEIPADADVVFIGGSTDWKRQAIHPFSRAFSRVHVGRVNTYRWLRVCTDAGAESCDGTGWGRGDQQQLAGLIQWLQEESGEVHRPRQQRLFSTELGVLSP